MSKPRGIRNNNPGNIDFNPRNAWQGQLGIEQGVANPRFARFDTVENGIRALAKLILNYRGKDGMPGVGLKGIDTVKEIINRWAPPVENDTGAYARQVAKAAGVKVDEVLNLKQPALLQKIVTAIIQHENGQQPYQASVIAEGVRRALL